MKQLFWKEKQSKEKQLVLSSQRLKSNGDFSLKRLEHCASHERPKPAPHRELLRSILLSRTLYLVRAKHL